MASCTQFEEALWEAAETQQVAPDLAEHLEQCRPCRRSLRSLASALEGLAALREVAAPDPTSAVRLATAARQSRGRLIGRLAAAAALSGAAAGLLLLTSRAATRSPVSPVRPDRAVASQGPTAEQAQVARQARAEERAPAPVAAADSHVKAARPHRHRPTRLRQRPAPELALTAKLPRPEATPQETPGADWPAEVEQRPQGVFLLLGAPQEALPSSSYQAEVFLPDGVRSFMEQSIERDAAGEPRLVQIAYHNTAPQPGARN